MIYVIVNLSHEWGDTTIDMIESVSTSLEKIEQTWDKYYAPMKKMDDSKWCYMAELREYKDDYFIHDFNSNFKILKTVKNG